ncbi:methylmalonyl Co-A mutase-associated GTPase MeaB [Tepidanaerobacter sp. GT38]|uniref:methylmalonyl Co-A mutase-associated GTPase MeaB n=1 Tax=Tepidanaerobacter sp. GT38 TaxID=2722793 RepID=UPI001F00F1BB|nr:methylmalonyl Co-A mutase-associated GTPase MeaB [Tepidanaerobacter sp. GT38]MCG1011970.1 methylmalonyl Co-A mutase-associated GTPase MeaB [Tepidanaerobacter sp. GT38]
MDIVPGILKGDKRSIARLITLIENQADEARDLLKQLYKFTGNAITLGITGPPGAGKSSIVNFLAKKFRENNKKVGVIAIDPTSPFSGGALLGDRIRMQDLTLDDGIYIRSMGSRGALGGLSRASYDAVKVLDAAGMDYIIIETVGVGQSEVDIIKLADIVALVLIPGMGDEVQAIKAGVMEIADIFVVNKSDMDGADRLITEIQMNLDLNQDKNKVKPPILKTVGTTGEGIADLYKTIIDVQKQLQDSGMLTNKRKTRINQELQELIREIHLKQIISSFETQIRIFTEKALNKEIDPYSAAVYILENAKL